LPFCHKERRLPGCIPLTELIPPEFGSTVTLILIAASAATSFVSAAAGLGGGVLLLALMAMVIPAAALIPVHGAVQIGSNGGRALITLRNVQYAILLPFVAGSAIGAGVGGLLAIQLPPYALKIGLGLFILWSVWGKTVKASGHLAVVGTGVFSSFLTMFFGATGMFISAMLKTLHLGRLEHVSTHAACMVAQHILKVIVFGLLGFAYGPYIGLIIAMIVSGFIGTVIGKRILVRMDDAIFHRVLAAVLTLLALKLLIEGWFET
jgi:uncharacterized membrane protein YfcA